MKKLTQEQLQREAERLMASGKMPTLDELCMQVLQTQKKYAYQIRRARREARGKPVN